MNILDSLFLWLTEATLRGALLILLVLAVQTILGRMISPQWRYALWLPVLLVLVTPMLPQSRWSLENLRASKVSLTAPTERPIPASDLSQIGKVEAGAIFQAEVVSTANDTRETERVAYPAWRRVVAIGWIAGAGGLLALSLAAYACTWRRIVKDSVAPAADFEEMLVKAAVVCGLSKAPRLILSPAVASPAVTGLFRPTLLLPAEFPGDLTEEEAQLVLRHELVHLKRWDLPVNWLLCLIQALHWCNPVLWLAVHRIRADREAACDAQVLALSHGDSRGIYGHALLKLEGTLASSGWTLGFVGIFEREVGMRRRICGIARYRPMHPATSVFAGVLLVVLTLAGATRAQEKAAPEGRTSVSGETTVAFTKMKESAKIQRKLETIVIPRLEFRKTTLEEALVLLRRQSVELDVAEPDNSKRGVQFVLGADVPRAPLNEARMTVSLAKIPLGDALRYITHLTGTKFKVGGDGVEIVLQSAPDPLILKEWKLQPAAGLKPGADARAFLTEEGVTFPDGATASLSPDATRLTVRNTKENIDRVDKVFDPDPPQEDPPKASLRQKLSTIIIPKLDLRQTPLREAVKLLMRTSWELDAAEEDSARRGVQIVVHRLDRPAEIPGPESTAVASAREGDEGEPRVTLSLKDIPLGEALRYVAGLTNHLVMVGPYSVTLAPKEITKGFVTKEWKLNDAMVSAMNDWPRDIADRLQARGIPFPAGAAAIWLRNSRKLIARNTQENHERIDNLLASFMGEPVPIAEQARAEALLIPAIVLEEMTLREAVDRIKAGSVTADPEKKGVNIVLDLERASQETKITLSLTNASVWDALRQVARIADVQLTAEARAVRIHQPGQVDTR